MDFLKSWLPGGERASLNVRRRSTGRRGRDDDDDHHHHRHRPDNRDDDDGDTDDEKEVVVNEDCVDQDGKRLNLAVKGIKGWWIRDKLPSTLDKYPKIVIVDLPLNDIGDDGAIALADILKKYNTIERLELRKNKIGDLGATAIAKALRGDVLLERIYFSQNDITDVGAAEWATTLRINRRLKKLGFSGNYIRDEGAFQLAYALDDNQTLTVLRLEGNRIGIHGYGMLLSILQRNMTLEELSIDKSEQEVHPVSQATFKMYEELLSLRTMGKREEYLAQLLFAKPGLVTKGERFWSDEAFDIAKDIDCFCIALEWALQADPEKNELLFAEDDFPFHIWKETLTKTNGGASVANHEYYDEKTTSDPIIHILIDQESSRTSDFLARYIDESKDRDRVVNRLLQLRDTSQRTLSSLMLAKKNLRNWALKQGTYLDRYEIQEDERPQHNSPTTEVYFAEDVMEGPKGRRKVALKFFKGDSGLESMKRELESRGIEDYYEITADEIDKQKKAYQMPVLAVYNMNSENRVLVLERGGRTLFDAMNTEQFAGKSFFKIQSIAQNIAEGLEILHNEKQRIHGDVKPRNIIRQIEEVKYVHFTTVEDGTKQHHTHKIKNRKGRKSIVGGGAISRPSRSWSTSSSLSLAPMDDESVGTFMLIDFDGSSSVSKVRWSTDSGRKPAKHFDPGMKFSSGYIPPEFARYLFTDQQRIPSPHASFDVWSFGVVLYELLSGLSLFPMTNQDNLFNPRDKAELVNWISIDSERLERIGVLLDDNERPQVRFREYAVDLLKWLLQPREFRPKSFSEVLEHPFFRVRSKDLDKLDHQELAKELRSTQPRYRFFLSHMQKEASGIVKDLYNFAQKMRFPAWLDVEAENLTKDGMEAGVKHSTHFLMVLTQGVLFRPYCIDELYWAIEDGKEIIFIVEVEDTYWPWTDAHVPWIDIEEFQRRIKKSGIPRYCKNEKAEEETKKQFERQMKNLRQLDDYKTKLERIEAKFYEKKRINYRRRGYEFEAMQDELLVMCGLVSPKTVREYETKKQSLLQQKQGKRILKALLPTRKSGDGFGPGTDEPELIKLEVLIVHGPDKDSNPVGDVVFQLWRAFKASTRRLSQKKHVEKGFQLGGKRFEFSGKKINAATSSFEDIDDAIRRRRKGKRSKKFDATVILLVLTDGIFPRKEKKSRRENPQHDSSLNEEEDGDDVDDNAKEMTEEDKEFYRFERKLKEFWFGEDISKDVGDHDGGVCVPIFVPGFWNWDAAAIEKVRCKDKELREKLFTGTEIIPFRPQEPLTIKPEKDESKRHNSTISLSCSGLDDPNNNLRVCCHFKHEFDAMVEEIKRRFATKFLAIKQPSNDDK